jgi:hypothetical protein
VQDVPRGVQGNGEPAVKPGASLINSNFDLLTVPIRHSVDVQLSAHEAAPWTITYVQSLEAYLPMTLVADLTGGMGDEQL